VYLLLDRFDDLLHAGHDESNSSSVPLLAILREGQLEVDQEQSIRLDLDRSFAFGLYATHSKR
jgi:hypothetical protein